MSRVRGRPDGRRRARAFALAALALLGLAGCSATRFESPPGDALDSCDTRWRGLWIARDDDGKLEDTAIEVDAGCRLLLHDQAERGGPVKAVHVPGNFARVARKDYVVVSDLALKPVYEFGPVPGVAAQPDKTFVLLRYEIRGDRLRLYDIDDDAVARLVLARKIDGTMLKSEDGLQVYVQGDRARIAQVLAAHDLFEHKATLLERSEWTAVDFERELLAQQARDGDGP